MSTGMHLTEEEYAEIRARLLRNRTPNMGKNALNFDSGGTSEPNPCQGRRPKFSKAQNRNYSARKFGIACFTDER